MKKWCLYNCNIEHGFHPRDYLPEVETVIYSQDNKDVLQTFEICYCILYTILMEYAHLIIYL